MFSILSQYLKTNEVSIWTFPKRRYTNAQKEHDENTQHHHHKNENQNHHEISSYPNQDDQYKKQNKMTSST
jgi:hypothetical protein